VDKVSYYAVPLNTFIQTFWAPYVTECIVVYIKTEVVNSFTLKSI
jgi:hypothetical protein